MPRRRRRPATSTPGALRDRAALRAMRTVNAASRARGARGGHRRRRARRAGARAGMLERPRTRAWRRARERDERQDDDDRAPRGRALATRGAVATNATGSNMLPGPRGRPRRRAPDARTAVLECDEVWLPRLRDVERPSVVVLLNLSRDQLDRTSEVRHVADAWRAALAGFEGICVANADDPLVVHAAVDAPSVAWFAGGLAFRGDAVACPAMRAAPRRSTRWGGAARAALARPDARRGRDRRPARSSTVTTCAYAMALPGGFNHANGLARAPRGGPARRRARRGGRRRSRRSQRSRGASLRVEFERAHRAADARQESRGVERAARPRRRRRRRPSWSPSTRRWPTATTLVALRRRLRAPRRSHGSSPPGSAGATCRRGSSTRASPTATTPDPRAAIAIGARRSRGRRRDRELHGVRRAASGAGECCGS